MDGPEPCSEGSGITASEMVISNQQSMSTELFHSPVNNQREYLRTLQTAPELLDR